ncbi:putative protein CWC15 [Blattamonas nauphoetae]|uniref:Pre-mRNA-splicing factor CWC15 n=1 Tax=Blattamonas nauphoetae TaxID=2049346 RepID=A0ABQ9X3U4_9EUKA|nr:putative protein CWC15 [Blattamonas nauphoetae]
MSGKATFRLRVGKAFTFPVASRQISVRDLPGHKQLKYRRPDSLPTPSESTERITQIPRQIDETVTAEEILQAADALNTNAVTETIEKQKRTESTKEFDDADEIPVHVQKAQRKHNKTHKQVTDTTVKLEGDEINNDSSSDSDSDSDSSSSDDFDEALLLAELERIKREKDESQRVLDTDARGNLTVTPGLFSSFTAESAQSFNARPRWNEDVVFRNQAAGEEKEKKRFINDTVRNDFHRKFLKRFLK